MLAKPEYFSLPDEACCRPGRRGGAAGTGSRRKQLAGVPWGSCWYGQPAEAAGGSAAGEMERSGSLCGKACRWASDDAAASRKSLPLGGRLCGCIVEKLAAGRATPLRHREEAEQHREGAEHHREEAKWQKSALYSIFIPMPQAPYCHTYHNKIQQRCVILRYRE